MSKGNGVVPDYSTNSVKGGNGKADAPPSTRSLTGLRELLFDELDHIRAGKGDPERTKSVVSVASTLLKIVHS